jgi:hypothetical protein
MRIELRLRPESEFIINWRLGFRLQEYRTSENREDSLCRNLHSEKRQTRHLVTPVLLKLNTVSAYDGTVRTAKGAQGT